MSGIAIKMTTKIERIACWDLDKTIVLAEDLDETLEEEEDRENEPWGVRFGIRNVLEKMIKRGYVNYLTTNTNAERASRILKANNLMDYFKSVFSHDELFDDNVRGKAYSVVARRHGIDLKLAKDMMLVIGDSRMMDMPSDIGGLVFLNQEDGYKYDAEVVNLILKKLESIDQSFNIAFQQLYKNTLVDCIGKRVVRLNELSFLMDYIEHENGRVLVPRIYEINAHGFIRKVEPIDE